MQQHVAVARVIALSLQARSRPIVRKLASPVGSPEHFVSLSLLVCIPSQPALSRSQNPLEWLVGLDGLPQTVASWMRSAFARPTPVTGLKDALRSHVALFGSSAKCHELFWEPNRNSKQSALCTTRLGAAAPPPQTVAAALLEEAQSLYLASTKIGLQHREL